MWHVPFRKSLMRGSQKHLAVKRDHGVPIAKLNFIKNRGQICPLFDFIYLLSFSFIASKKFLIVSFFSVFAFASTMQFAFIYTCFAYSCHAFFSAFLFSIFLLLAINSAMNVSNFYATSFADSFFLCRFCILQRFLFCRCFFFRWSKKFHCRLLKFHLLS